MAYAQELVDLIDERIRKYMEPTTGKGTVVTRTGNTTAMVTFDGSSKATPVKCFGDVNVDQGDRVGMVRLGVDWTIVGTFTRRRSITMPDGAVLGTQRMVWGADTPPELATYGLTVAMLAYVTDNVTGVELGYFFISVSNLMDAAPGYRAMVFGNVTYPTPGVPSSATVGDVKTNMQMDHWAQNRKTIFKDHDVDFWYPANIMFDGIGFGRGIKGRADSASNSAAIGAAETTVLATGTITFKAGRAYAAEWRAGISGSGAGALGVRIRKTNPAGQQLSVFGWTFPAAQTLYFGERPIFRIGGGGDVAASIALTTQSGAGTNTHIGAAGDTRYLEITDIGTGNDYVSAPTLV